MNRVTRWAVGVAGFCGILLAADAGTATAQQEAAVQSGVAYLRNRAGKLQVGETAMIALAMIKAEVPPTDPALSACIAKIRSRFSSSEYSPERGLGQAAYEAGATAMALANHDPEGNRGYLGMIVRYLLSVQNPNGSWDYSGRNYGDTSITQYAVLGLWEAENCGVEISPAVWERIASWLMSTQCEDGGWIYHKDEGVTYSETVAMTAAAVGSLLICHRQLEPYIQRKEASAADEPGRRGGDRLQAGDQLPAGRAVGPAGDVVDLGALHHRDADDRQHPILHAVRHRANGGAGRPPDNRPARLV